MKNLIVNGLLVLTSLTITLVLCEVWLRVSGYSSSVRNITELGRDRVINSLSGVRYLYKRNAHYTQKWPDDDRGYFGTSDNSITYRVNNYGFRGDDFAIGRNGAIRIAVIGDSICWGQGVKEKDRFTALIKLRLNQNKILGQNYEIYNFCMPGFNTQSEVALYEHVVQYFQPDILLIAYFLNDVNLPPELFFWWRPWAPKKLEKWRKRLRLVDWAVTLIREVRARPAFISSVNAAYEPGHPGYESVVAGFRRIARLNFKQDCPTLLTVFPSLGDSDRDSYPFHKVHRAVGQAGREQGFDVLDLFEFFEGHEATELWVHRPTDQHPNEEAHRIAADAMYLRLVEVLTRSGDELLAKAAQRRLIPVPSDLRDSPENEWYEVFAARAQRRVSLAPPLL